MATDNNSKNLVRKRLAAAALIAGWSSGVGLSTGIRGVFKWFQKDSDQPAPEPQALLTDVVLATTFGPLALCVFVYRVYFDHRVNFEMVKKSLLDSGILMLGVGGAGYAVTTKASGIAQQFAKLVGPTAGPIVASTATNLIIGAAWAFMVDDAYRNGSGPGALFERMSQLLSTATTNA